MTLQGGHGALTLDQTTSIARFDPGHCILAMRRGRSNLREGFVPSLSRGQIVRKRRRDFCSRQNRSAVAAGGEFDFSLDGPIEPPIPKFNREPYVQVSPVLSFSLYILYLMFICYFRDEKYLNLSESQIRCSSVYRGVIGMSQRLQISQ